MIEELLKEANLTHYQTILEPDNLLYEFRYHVAKDKLNDYLK